MTSKSNVSNENGNTVNDDDAATRTGIVPVFSEFSPGWDPLALLRYVGIREDVAKKIVCDYEFFDISPPTIPELVMDYFERAIERYESQQTTNYLDVLLLDILEEKTARSVASLVRFGLSPPMSESVLYWLQCWVDAVFQIGASCRWLEDVPPSGEIETIRVDRRDHISVRVLNIRLGHKDPKLDLSLYDPEEFGHPKLFHGAWAHEYLQSLATMLRPTWGRKDFGTGFYLQASFEGAVFWALKRAAVSQTTGTVAVLVALYQADATEIVKFCHEPQYGYHHQGMKTFSSVAELRDEVMAWRSTRYPRIPADNYCVVSGASEQTGRRQIAVKHDQGCGYLRTRCTGIVRIFANVDELENIINRCRMLF